MRGDATLSHGKAPEKQERLFASLSRLDSLLVAFSGGADSAYLAWSAHRVLRERALALTALSPSFSAHDREQAAAFVQTVGLRHEWIKTQEFANPLYVANGVERCYHCKNELFRVLGQLATERGFAAIAYGMNADDTRDFRPGHRAAGEHNVLAPLLDAGLTKAEIRSLSRQAGLPTWDRPASPCLSSRVPFGTPITPEVLAKIERGEAALRGLGFPQVRLRYYGELARVEIPREELPGAFEAPMRERIVQLLRRAGFARVIIDPNGYRQGSLNTAIME